MRGQFATFGSTIAKLLVEKHVSNRPNHHILSKNASKIAVLAAKSSILSQGVIFSQNFQNRQKCSQYPRVPIGTTFGVTESRLSILEHLTFFFPRKKRIFAILQGLYL